MKLLTVKTLGNKEVTNYTTPTIKKSIDEIDSILCLKHNELCVLDKSLFVTGGPTSDVFKDVNAKMTEMQRIIETLSKTVDTLSRELKTIKDSAEPVTLSVKK